MMQSNAIFQAIEWQDHATIDQLLQDKQLIIIRDDEGNTPLHIAIAYHDMATCQKLLSKEADVNATTHEGNTPLHYAGMMGDTEIAALLLAQGANSNAKNKDNLTPIELATSLGYPQLLSLTQTDAINGLLSFEEMASSFEEPELHRAIDKGDSEMVRNLLLTGANINQRDSEGQPPLHKAILANQLAIVHLLMENGADANSRNLHQQTAWELIQPLQVMTQAESDINALLNYSKIATNNIAHAEQVPLALPMPPITEDASNNLSLSSNEPDFLSAYMESMHPRGTDASSSMTSINMSSTLKFDISEETPLPLLIKAISNADLNKIKKIVSQCSVQQENELRTYLLGNNKTPQTIKEYFSTVKSQAEITYAREFLKLAFSLDDAISLAEL
ncbi:MAG: ankyrin repeat domain-containing protein, partial [Burkholderiales bacterium]